MSSDFSSAEPRRARYGRELVLAVVALLVAIAVLAAATATIVQRSVDVQNRLRAAARTNQTALTLQLDEETGVRAYVATRSAAFLEPYESARQSLPIVFDGFLRELRSVGASELTPTARAMIATNGQWFAEFAGPAVATGRASIARQQRGKELVDRYRSEQASIAVRLDAAIALAQRDAQHRLVQLFALIAALALAGVAVPFAASIRQRELVQRQASLERAYAEERSIVTRLQEAFAGRQLVNTPSIQVDAVYAPASKREKVGGDWYDTLALPDGRVFFSIGDVSGHGVNAAITMSRARQIILAAAIDERDPARILEKTNAVLHMQGEESLLSAQCGWIEPTTQTVRFASAGHPPPVLASADGRARFLASGGVPIGFEPQARYVTHDVATAAGAMLVCYTDGITECGRDILVGERTLLEEIARGIGLERPAAYLYNAITAACDPGDDIAILTISFTPGVPATETTWQRESGTSGPRRYAETSTSVVAPNSPESLPGSLADEPRSSTWRRSATRIRRRSRSS